MPAHFFKPSPALFDACPERCIVTPNERLCREFSRTYNEAQIAQGRRAWERPKVISLQRYFLNDAMDNPIGPHLLSRDAEFVLWQELADANATHLTSLAQDAWRLLQQWQIDLEDVRFQHTHNGRTLQRWATRFRQRLREANLITEAELPGAIVPRPVQIELLAFDVITPLVRDYLKAVEAAGGTVTQHAAPTSQVQGRPARTQKRIEVTSRPQEIHAAAQWSRQCLSRQPSARIGIVVPYLTQSYAMIDHAFGVEFGDTTNAYDISGGVALTQQPVWRTARQVLHLVFARLTHAQLIQLCNAPFTNLANLSLPAGLREDVHIGDLKRGNPTVDTLSALRQSVRSGSYGAWIEVFQSALAAAGWVLGSGSVQYQAYLAIVDALDGFRALRSLPNCTADVALMTLERMLEHRLFAPERAPAPVQILGPLETTGLTFTHLWVAGLQDTAWPAVPTPNPLLPISLQRQHNVPRVDHEAERHFAERQTARWHEATRNLVVSYASDDGEEQHQCSELVSDIDLVELRQLIPGYRRRRHPWLKKPPTSNLQPMLEQSGSPVTGIVTKGGTSLLRNQAQCPFRAWAIHRLDLREPQPPHSFPNPLERGLLVHDALHELYLANGLNADVGEQQIAAAATHAVAKHLRNAPKLYRDSEVARLQRLLLAWIELEAQRPGFTIIGLEMESRLELPGMQLSLRIDRLDEVQTADGARQLVIDYKTGAAVANRLLTDRLIEPQLPIYALTTPAIRATLFARIAENGVRMTGLADDAIELGPVRRTRLPDGGWPALTDRWQQQLDDLVGEYRSGFAAVQPYAQSVCDNCHLKSFCRIDAMTDS